MGLHPSWHPDRLLFYISPVQRHILSIFLSELPFCFCQSMWRPFWTSEWWSQRWQAPWTYHCGCFCVVLEFAHLLYSWCLKPWTSRSILEVERKLTVTITLLSGSSWSVSSSLWLTNGKEAMSSANRVDLTSWEARYQWGQWETRKDAVGYAMAYQLRYWLFLLHCLTLPPFPLLQMVISVDLVVLLFLILF